MTQKIIITQIKSAIGYPKNQKATLKALNLKKLHNPITHTATPPILGMVNTIKHLVTVQKIK